MYPSETSLRTHSNALLTLVLLTAVTACEPSTSSSTHWLQCKAVSECATTAAVECVDGYCVDSSGNRISRDATSTGASGGSSGMSSTQSTVTPATGGRGGNSAIGTTSVAIGQGGSTATGASTTNGGSNSSTASGGTTQGTGGTSGVDQLGGGGNNAGDTKNSSEATTNARGGAAGNGGSSIQAGGATNNGGSKSGIAGGGTNLGGSSAAAGASSAGAAGVCSVTTEFLEPLKTCNVDTDCEKQRYQVNCCGTNAWISVRADKVAALQACLATRPAFPMCGCASTGDTVEDGRYASYNGNDVAARCVSNRCLTQVSSRSCGPTNPITCTENQLCVAYETTIGPTSSIEYACAANPCSDQLSCTCAQSVCTLRTDTTRTCNQPMGAGITNFIDINCQDNRQ